MTENNRKYFGTDGMRGPANQFPVTAQVALRLGMAAGRLFTRGNHKHRAVIGKDTRLSGYMIESSLMAGLTSMGIDVFLLGPLPTPALAFITRSLRADLGLMISASHNGFQDNGIKLFGPDGYKLSDEMEQQIERYMDNGLASHLAPPEQIGRAKRIEDAQARYIEFAKRSRAAGTPLDGLRIVLDCANGAAYKLAPAALWELGADVITIHDRPNGLNINQNCGATHPQAMQEAVRAHKADIGIAFDGDADRIAVADEKGGHIDGDQILALLAHNWKVSETLAKPGIVATILSNLGLERHLHSLGLGLARTRVGDRYVAEYMRRHGFNLGGERSGHLLLTDFSTTGDGLIAALHILDALAAQNRPASELCARFRPVPQIEHNIPADPANPLEAPHIQSAIQNATERLGGGGRLVVRRSGTEPVIRIMGQGDDENLIRDVIFQVAERLEPRRA